MINLFFLFFIPVRNIRAVYIPPASASWFWERVQLPLPPPICWLPELKASLSTLLLGLASFSVGGRVPPRGQKTDVAYIMISKSVISVALILLASLHTSPHGCLVVLRQALLCRSEPKSPRRSAPSHHQLGSENQWVQLGGLHWMAITNIHQKGDRHCYRFNRHRVNTRTS